MPPFDFDMAQFIHRHLKEKKVNLLLKEGIAGFEEKENSIIAKFDTGRS
jgi:flagellar assembly factor FliW